jgi:SAM-dependent methyltransferase
MQLTHWNQCYAEANTPWDKGQPSPPLVQALQKHAPQGRVLLPGCGAGHDAAYVASLGCEVLAVDIAPLAIERAKAAHPELPDSTWLLGDLFELPKTQAGSFDAIVEHTCLCAMPPSLRTAYRDAVLALLKPGGLLIGVWFINPDLDPGETGPPFPLPVEELDALFKDGFEIIDDYVPEVAFEGRLGRERVRVLRRR